MVSDIAVPASETTAAHGHGEAHSTAGFKALLLGSIGVVYGDAQLFGESSEISRVPDFSLARLVEGNFIDACAVYRRSVWEEVGGYDENMLLGWEDWEFWLRVALKNWGFRHLDAVLFDYRVRDRYLVGLLATDGTRAVDPAQQDEDGPAVDKQAAEAHDAVDREPGKAMLFRSVNDSVLSSVARRRSFRNVSTSAVPSADSEMRSTAFSSLSRASA